MCFQWLSASSYPSYCGFETTAPALGRRGSFHVRQRGIGGSFEQGDSLLGYDLVGWAGRVVVGTRNPGDGGYTFGEGKVAL